MKADEREDILRELRALRRDTRSTVRLMRELVTGIREELRLFRNETERRLTDLERGHSGSGYSGPG